MASRKSAFRAVLATLVVIAAAPLLVILLPLLLPVIAAGAVLSERALARTGCPNCGQAFGRAEVRRAKRVAAAAARGLTRTMMALGLRPRVVTTWRLNCPRCGFAYGYRAGDPPGALTLLGQTPPK